MRLFKLIIIGYIILFCQCSHQTPASSDMKTMVEKGDIIRNHYIDTSIINLYQGNGRFGSSFAALGLHVHPSKLHTHSRHGRTQLMHMQHYIRGKFNADYLIPLGRIYWKNEPANITEYIQHQSMYDGTITTSFKYNSGKIKMVTWFDPVHRNVFGIDIELEGESPDIIMEPRRDLIVHYGQSLKQNVSFRKAEDQHIARLTCLNASDSIFIKTNAEVITDSNYYFKLLPGKNSILISVNDPATISDKESLTSTKEWWHKQWQNSGFIETGVSDVQKMWVRSMSQFLSTYNDDSLGLPPPMGLTGNGWPFNFPQDVSFIHPVLIATGHTNIAKAWIEYFGKRLDGMEDYTKRLLPQANGILCPWVFPYGDLNTYHTPAPPNKFYYEIHNSAYLCRMAHETGIMINDEEWKKKYVTPIIKACADFYQSISRKEADGKWHIQVNPSCGQDEMGGENQKNYLDALFSAQYCLERAVEYHLDSAGILKTILQDGFAYPSLMSPKGFYYSYKGGEKDFGKQKHPVQLNPFTILPIKDNAIQQATFRAYQNRYDITLDARKPHFYGWTLGMFILSGSRSGDIHDWKTDWDNLLKSNYIDKDWIQVYETSDMDDQVFYTTTNGLICQSLIENIVSCWQGNLEIGKCIPWNNEIHFSKLKTLCGVTVDGTIKNTRASLQLTAWKDCAISVNGQMLSLKKDEVKSIKINKLKN